MNTHAPTTRNTTSRSKHHGWLYAATLAAAAFFLPLQPAAAQKTWVGADGIGGDGRWVSGNFNPTGLPSASGSGSAHNVVFERTATWSNQSATVTIDVNPNAGARGLAVKNDKLVTILFSNNTSLTVTNQAVSVSSGSNASTASLTLQGPTNVGESATANLSRLYLDDTSSNNVGTSHANSMILAGNLNVNMTTGYSAVSGRSSITILDGVNLTSQATNQSSDFYIRKGDKIDNIYDNRISLLGGSTAIKSLHVSQGSGSGYGLLQLGKNAILTNTTGTNLVVTMYSGARFEAEGSGLSSGATISLSNNATLAIGLTDPTTGLRDEAGEFTLQSSASFASGARLEFTIFGANQDEADHLILSGNDALLSGNVTLVLNLGNSFSPQSGSWSLMTGTSTNITASFNPALVSTNIWDLSQFNEAGNWTVAAIPATNLYWTANGNTLGGAGTWNTSGTNWTVNEIQVDGSTWSDAKKAVFTNSAATVTVGTVTVEKGILFTTTGYTLNDGTITLGGTNINDNTITANTNVTTTINSVLDGDNGLTKAGIGTLILGGTNTYTGDTVVSAGTLQGSTDSLRGNISNSGVVTFLQNSNGSYSDVLSGSGSLTKSGTGTLTFSGTTTNSLSGTVTVSEGTLQLNKTAGAMAIAGNLTVNSGAKLLLSSSNQVADTSAVTLSGGTIQRAADASETFGNLNLTTASFLDYGTDDIGTLAFGTYTPSALLTVNNFFEGNVLVFKSDLSGNIHNDALFNFDNGFIYDWDNGTSTFTITAIPEPSTYAAAIGLIGLLFWAGGRHTRKAKHKL